MKFGMNDLYIYVHDVDQLLQFDDVLSDMQYVLIHFHSDLKSSTHYNQFQG